MNNWIILTQFRSLSFRLLTSTEYIDNLHNFFAILPKLDMGTASGSDLVALYHDLSSTYTIYNWELTFHILMALIENSPVVWQSA